MTHQARVCPVDGAEAVSYFLYDWFKKREGLAEPRTFLRALNDLRDLARSREGVR